VSASSRVQMVSPMQEAFVNAVVQADPSKLKSRVFKSVQRGRIREERAVDLRVSYRTAQQLKQEGVL
jgi:hypothetical protein